MVWPKYINQIQRGVILLKGKNTTLYGSLRDEALQFFVITYAELMWKSKCKWSGFCSLLHRTRLLLWRRRVLCGWECGPGGGAGVEGWHGPVPGFRGHRDLAENRPSLRWRWAFPTMILFDYSTIFNFLWQNALKPKSFTSVKAVWLNVLFSWSYCYTVGKFTLCLLLWESAPHGHRLKAKL